MTRMDNKKSDILIMIKTAT